MRHLPEEKEQSTLALHLKPLQPFLDNPRWTEICINRPGEVFTEEASGWMQHHLPALTQSWCLQVAKLIANSSTQSIDQETPLLSAHLPTGERVQVVIPPAVPEGTASITIRKPSSILFSMADLTEKGVFQHVKHEAFDTSDPMDDLTDEEHQLMDLLKRQQIENFIETAVKTKKNMVISGATGSGKTTFTNSIVQLIPHDERIITIEDVLELKLPHHPNHVRLLYSKDGQGLSKVTPKQLLESCLRMKPDRILLSELRSDEAYYFLRNVNSGHPGSITTVHANTPYLAFEQLMLLIKESQGGSQLKREDIKKLLMMLIDVIIQFKQERGLGRIVTGIYYDPISKRRAFSE